MYIIRWTTNEYGYKCTHMHTHGYACKHMQTHMHCKNLHNTMNATITTVIKLNMNVHMNIQSKLKINIEKGTLHFLYLTTKYLSILVDPLLFSVLINFDSSL